MAEREDIGPKEAIAVAFSGMRASVRTDLRPPEDIPLYMADEWLAEVALEGLEAAGYSLVRRPAEGTEPEVLPREAIAMEWRLRSMDVAPWPATGEPCRCRCGLDVCEGMLRRPGRLITLNTWGASNDLVVCESCWEAMQTSTGIQNRTGRLR